MAGGGSPQLRRGRRCFGEGRSRTALVEKEGRNVCELFPAKNSPLGIVPIVSAREVAFNLEGGSFHIFTDALTEGCREDGDKPLLAAPSRSYYINSSGVASLVEALRLARKSSLQFGLVSVGDSAFRVSRLANLNKAKGRSMAFIAVVPHGTHTAPTENGIPFHADTPTDGERHGPHGRHAPPRKRHCASSDQGEASPDECSGREDEPNHQGGDRQTLP